jgi:hypothetical protein
MRGKFKIFVNGAQVKPPKGGMFVCNSDGIFFIVHFDDYYYYIERLSKVYPKYDVVWTSEETAQSRQEFTGGYQPAMSEQTPLIPQAPPKKP